MLISSVGPLLNKGKPITEEHKQRLEDYPIAAEDPADGDLPVVSSIASWTCS